MRKAKSTKLFAFLGFTGCVLMVVLGLYYHKNALVDQNGQDIESKKQLIKVSEKIWKVWREGVDSELYRDIQKECPLEDTSKSYQCSEELLSCVLEKSSIKVPLKGKGRVEFGRLEKISKKENGAHAPGEGVRLTLGLGSSKVTLFLEKSCHKLFLPKRIYGFGTEKNPPREKRFDNFESLIFIDRDQTEVVGKTKKQMEEMCSVRGMQLLQSHYLDAASFHPVDIKNNRPQGFLRPPLPWGRAFKGEFLNLAEKDKKFKFKPVFCEKIYTKECLETKNESLPSWMGLRNPLGGSLEVVNNILSPDSSLVPTSTYFTIHSPWHRLGLRAMWNGQNLEKRDFNFGKNGGPELENYKDLKLAFRCMQEVWQ